MERTASATASPCAASTSAWRNLATISSGVCVFFLPIDEPPSASAGHIAGGPLLGGQVTRGSLTVWFTPEAIEAWRAEPRTGRGGQSRYSALAITTALTLRAVFRLALRQTEGLIGSILALLGLDLAVPDHTTLKIGRAHV